MSCARACARAESETLAKAQAQAATTANENVQDMLQIQFLLHVGCFPEIYGSVAKTFCKSRGLSHAQRSRRFAIGIRDHGRDHA